jgi:hypothetical protein
LAIEREIKLGNDGGCEGLDRHDGDHHTTKPPTRAMQKHERRDAAPACPQSDPTGR